MARTCGCAGDRGQHRKGCAVRKEPRPRKVPTLNAFQNRILDPMAKRMAEAFEEAIINSGPYAYETKFVDASFFPVDGFKVMKLVCAKCRKGACRCPRS